MPKRKKTHSWPEPFGREALCLADQPGRAATDVARELGILAGRIYKRRFDKLPMTSIPKVPLEVDPSSRQEHSPRRAWPLWSTCVVLVALVGCGKGASDTSPPDPPAVTVARAAEREIIESFEFVGRVAAIEEVELSARVTGYLQERIFVEGLDVEEGDVLFVIEPDEFRAAAAEAKARLEQAKAGLTNAESALKRQAMLFKRGTVSEAGYDNALALRDEANASVAAREAELQMAELKLDYTQITAPFSGRMGRTAFSKGDVVGPDRGPLATLVQVDPIHVYFAVSEHRLLQAQKNRRFVREEKGIRTHVNVKLRLADGEMYEHSGRIDFVDNRIDPATGSITTRGVFPNGESLLTPNQYLTVVIEPVEPITAVTVPQAAIQEDQRGRYVLVVDLDNRVQVRRIDTGSQHGPDWVVTSGLEPGEMIIVEGIQKVRSGITVNPGTPMTRTPD